MKMLRNIFLVLLVLSGCSRDWDEMDEAASSSFVLDTKVVKPDAGDTFRVLMFDEDARGYLGSGSYYIKAGTDELVACRLDTDGSNPQEDPDMGIKEVRYEQVNLVLVSPGVEGYGDGSFDYYPDSDRNFYVTAPELKTIGGYGKVRLGNPLYEPRVSLSFEFYKKPEVDDFSVNANQLKVIGVQGKDAPVRIYPALRQVSYTPVERAVGLTYDPDHTVTPGVKNYERFYYTANQDTLSIAAGIYAPKQDAVEYLGVIKTDNVLDGNYLYLFCTVNQAGRNIDIQMPLNDRFIELLPQNRYVYKVLIESDYITLLLDVYNGSGHGGWESGGENSETVGGLSETIEIGTWKFEDWPSSGGDIDFDIG